MVVAHKYIYRIYASIERHVPQENIGPLLDALEKVGGNQSYLETLRRLRQHYRNTEVVLGRRRGERAHVAATKRR